jgi:predicted peptidase
MKNISRTAVILAGAFLASVVSAAEQPEAGKMIKVSPKQDNLIPYWLYLPKEHAKKKDKLPVVVFLHGLGERGNNLDRVLVHGPPKLIARGTHFPFIMIAPQCPNDGRKENRNAKSFWWHPEGPIDKVKNIVEFERKRLGRIDADRIYITGLSMGGFGTYQIVSHHPDYFAAAAPICGHGNRIEDKKALQKAFANLPVWAFHGNRDNVVRLAEQQQTIKLLEEGGATIRFTVYPGVGHDSWTRTYNNPDFYKWLLSHKRAHKKDGSAE